MESGRQASVREITETVGNVFTGCRVSFGPPSEDNRSYRVSFEKIRKHLPGFTCAWDARRGAEQLHDLFERIEMTKEVFEYWMFTRLKQLECLDKDAADRSSVLLDEGGWDAECFMRGNRARMGRVDRSLAHGGTLVALIDQVWKLTSTAIVGVMELY